MWHPHIKPVARRCAPAEPKRSARRKTAERKEARQDSDKALGLGLSKNGTTTHTHTLSYTHKLIYTQHPPFFNPLPPQWNWRNLRIISVEATSNFWKRRKSLWISWRSLWHQWAPEGTEKKQRMNQVERRIWGARKTFKKKSLFIYLLFILHNGARVSVALGGVHLGQPGKFTVRNIYLADAVIDFYYCCCYSMASITLLVFCLYW